VAAVELALLLAPLVLVVFAAAELGRAVHTFNTLGKGVRDAARHLSQFGTADEVVAQARCLSVHGSVDCSGPTAAPGLSTTLVRVCDAQRCPSSHASQSTGQGSIALVSVEIVGYRWIALPGGWVPDLAFPAIGATMRAPQ
jgi:Flp pilus assembly protein TadG